MHQRVVQPLDLTNRKLGTRVLLDLEPFSTVLHERPQARPGRLALHALSTARKKPKFNMSSAGFRHTFQITRSLATFSISCTLFLAGKRSCDSDLASVQVHTPNPNVQVQPLIEIKQKITDRHLHRILIKPAEWKLWRFKKAGTR
jgi:hypothetical protein